MPVLMSPDLMLARYYALWLIGYYGLCLLIAVWRCKSGWLHRITLAFAITRVPVVAFWLVLGVHLMELWAIGLALATMVMAATPYILVRPELRERVAGQAKRLLPYMQSSAMVSTRLAKAGASSTVAAVMAMEEQRRLARAARLERQGDTEAAAAVEEGPAKSDHELLIEKYGKYYRGWDPVTIYAADGTPTTIWPPPKRQLLGANPHLWFSAIKTASFIGFGIFVLMQLPAWMRPIAVAGVAGAGLLSYLPNPLHLFGL